MSSQTQLVKQLNAAEIEYDSNILNELICLVNELDLSNEDLVNEWEAYQYNNKSDKIDATSINPSSFQNFSKYLRYSKSAKVVKKTRSRSNSNNNKSFIHNSHTLKPLMEISTPSANNLNKTRNRRQIMSATRNNNNNKASSFMMDNQMNAFLNMSTPSKSNTNKIPSSIRSSVKSSINKKNNKIYNKNNNNNDNFKNMMQSPAPINNKYKSRKRKGEIVCSLNDTLNHSNIRCQRININVIDKIGNNRQQQKQYRFMYENIHAKQEIIKDRIRYIGNYILNKIKKEKSNDKKKSNDNGDEKDDDDNDNSIEFSSIDEPSQRSCYFLGRIMNDGDNAGSDKITGGNIILEGDADLSFGKRVKLDLSSLKSLSLFPGQIVVIKGINSSGKEINVEKIYDNSYLTEKTKEINNNYNNNDNNDTLKIMVASGPFTPKNSLEFNESPLFDFAQIVIKNKPNCVILMGPFTDCDNELIKNNEINITFDQLFKHILSSFMNIINGFDIKLIVIPSTKDVHHFTGFPQEKYMANNLIMNENITFMNNPTEFNINNVSFGICSSDFIFNCCKIGLTKNISDRLLSIMSHCINQQNFYPLQPSTSSLRMDFSDNNKCKHLYIKQKLDIFIMPSTLKQFAKIYKNTNTICINPSFLTKLNSGGTYAVLNINKSNNYNINDYTDFIHVDILRI